MVKNIFANIFLVFFFTSKVSECHVKHCLGTNHTKSVSPFEKDEYVSF